MSSQNGKHSAAHGRYSLVGAPPDLTLEMPPDMSVVAPAYNEREGIGEFITRVRDACDGCAPSFEIVVVDDGSTDGTWAALRDLSDSEPRLVCVKLSRNHGHQLALTAGLSVCRGRRVLIIDADLQDPPELLPRMMELMDGGADVVYGQRRGRAGETRFKLWTASAFYRLIDRISDTTIPRDTGDFRLISRRALEVLLAMPERRRFIRGMVSWIGFTQAPILYDRERRFAGRTKFSVAKMVRFALDALTSFSIRPLVWCAGVGIACLLLGVLGAGGAVIAWAAGLATAWALVVSVVVALAGVQLLFLGVLGVYVGRMAEQLRGRPLFIIEEVVRAAGPPGGEPMLRRAGVGGASV